MSDPIKNKPLSRRKFLGRATLAGSASALTLFLQACARIFPSTEPSAAQTASPTPATQPAPTGTSTNKMPSLNPTATTPPTPTETGTARVAFVKTNDRAAGVRAAVTLLGINPAAGKRVFLKPNFNSADPAPGSTHVDILAALVSLLQEMGAASIIVGDRSGMGNTRAVMEQVGAFRLAKTLGFDTLVLDELEADGWQMVQPDGGHWEQGFPLARAVLEADAVVQACCLKTHRYGGHFTLSLKNSVGLVGKRIPGNHHNFMTELHGSPHQRRMIAEINAAYTPALVVMDGVEAFISGGPDNGERVNAGVVLAGTDRVALDAVGVALLRFHGCRTEVAQGSIFEQEQIARAVELGLGVDSPGKIELVTADDASAAYADQIRAVLMQS